MTVVFLLTTSLQSVAAVVMVEQPCPMQEQALANQHADHQSEATPDCCEHDEAGALNERACKTGADCHAGQLSVTIAAVTPVLDTEISTVTPLFVPLFPPPELASIWRPPARLAA